MVNFEPILIAINCICVLDIVLAFSLLLDTTGINTVGHPRD